jgi:UDP-N-acetylmuramate dehydrogenase
MPIAAHVPLAALTTLELGGPAEHFTRVTSRDELHHAVEFARGKGLPLTVLGGGSNIVVSSAGIAGLVVHMATRGISVSPSGGKVHVTAEAGEPWDDFVALNVAAGRAGIECLSGIPGLVGATPIQNVGAYGQEVSSTIASVEVLDLRDGSTATLSHADCAFAYRDSRLKRERGRWTVLAVTFSLEPGGAPTVAYRELEQALAVGPATGATARPRTLAEVRETVLSLRRRKSMVLDPSDENRRSAGSFFTNPILPAAAAESVIALAVAQGMVARAEEVPRYPAGSGKTKLAAGWLIERAGVTKGLRSGAFGVSSKHALALVHHGGGRAEDLRAFAESIRGRVHEVFGVRLDFEPEFIGEGW